MSSVTQLAYLAGMIDGEGSVTMYLGKKDYNLKLKVQVYSCNEDVIDWCKLHFGGCKYKVGRRINPKHQQEFAWHISSNNACDILIDTLPYLIIKLARAKIAIEAWQNRCPTPIVKRREPIPEEVIVSRQNYMTAFKEAVGVTRQHNN